MSNYYTIALISHTSKVILKNLQAGFNSILTDNSQMFNLDLEKAEEPEIKLPNPLTIEKAREFQRNIYFCFISYTKAFDCVDQHKLWKILKERGLSDCLTCFLKHLYAGQEATELDMEQRTVSK